MADSDESSLGRPSDDATPWGLPRNARGFEDVQVRDYVLAIAWRIGLEWTWIVGKEWKEGKGFKARVVCIGSGKTRSGKQDIPVHRQDKEGTGKAQGKAQVR